jgi:signal transduction histidine kinase
VVRHAGVVRAEVSFVDSGDNLTVTVVDDGAGFDEATVAEDRFGLRDSVRGRIAAIGGSTRVLSSPGNGTVVVITVPLGGGTV